MLNETHILKFHVEMTVILTLKYNDASHNYKIILLLCTCLKYTCTIRYTQYRIIIFAATINFGSRALRRNVRGLQYSYFNFRKPHPPTALCV